MDCFSIYISNQYYMFLLYLMVCSGYFMVEPCCSYFLCVSLHLLTMDLKWHIKQLSVIKGKKEKERGVHCKALSYQVLLSCVVWSTANLVHTPTLASILFFLLMDYHFCSIKELEQFLTHGEFESLTVHSGEALFGLGFSIKAETTKDFAYVS